MDSYLQFKARCSKCGYEWLQDGYTRGVLFQLLRSQSSIEAYCMRCGLLWPISATEQRALSEKLTKE
jgi:hypothetical protein